MGNVTGVCFEENPLSEERAVFQEWKNASESLRVSRAILYFLFSYLSGIKDGDEQRWKVWLCFWQVASFNLVQQKGGKKKTKKKNKAPGTHLYV